MDLKSKDDSYKHIRKKLGFLVYMPASGSGNLNNGYVSQQFFDPKSQNTICEMIHNDANRENYKVLLRDITVMLTAFLSERPWNSTGKLRQLVIDIMHQIHTAFFDEKGKFGTSELGSIRRNENARNIHRQFT